MVVRLSQSTRLHWQLLEKGRSASSCYSPLILTLSILCDERAEGKCGGTEPSPENLVLEMVGAVVRRAICERLIVSWALGRWAYGMA
jgi:hypothetical protein